MEDKKLEKVLQIIRENMVANAPGTQGGFGSKSDASGPTAGCDRPIKKRYAKGGCGSRKNWLDYLRTSNGRSN